MQRLQDASAHFFSAILILRIARATKRHRHALWEPVRCWFQAPLACFHLAIELHQGFVASQSYAFLASNLGICFRLTPGVEFAFRQKSKPLAGIGPRCLECVAELITDHSHGASVDDSCAPAIMVCVYVYLYVSVSVSVSVCVYAHVRPDSSLNEQYFFGVSR